MLNFSYPKKVKLIFGIIFNPQIPSDNIKAEIAKNFGRIETQSPVFDFNSTNYYEKEMGKGLKRIFLTARKLINPEDIVRIKIRSVNLEKAFSYKNKRKVNIDPGYIDLAKLVLSTTKDFSHRIYLRKGIFAEVTLIYQNNHFRNLKWTFPDYRTKKYKSFFYQIRDLYKKQLYAG